MRYFQHISLGEMLANIVPFSDELSFANIAVNLYEQISESKA